MSNPFLRGRRNTPEPEDTTSHEADQDLPYRNHKPNWEEILPDRIRQTVTRDEAAERTPMRKNPLVKLISGGIAAMIALMLILSSFSIVPTKQVGIPVTLGRPGTPVGNGLHFKWPVITQMVKMDATTQTLDAAEENPTVAKDIDRSDVYVHNNVRWAIKEDAADSLYRDYREFENISDSLVQPAQRETISAVMADYNPLGEDNPSNPEIAEQIKQRMQDKVGDRVEIKSVTVTLLDFSDATKDRINQLNTERGNTRIAEQRKETARAEAEANEVLSKSVSKDPNVLVSKCLDLIAEGKNVPAGFQCWPGAGSGAAPDVIVDSTTKTED